MSTTELLRALRERQILVDNRGNPLPPIESLTRETAEELWAAAYSKNVLPKTYQSALWVTLLQLRREAPMITGKNKP